MCCKNFRMLVQVPPTSTELITDISKFCFSDPDEVLYPHRRPSFMSKNMTVTHETTKVDFITNLPPELGLNILKYLDIPSLIQASRTCKNWSNIIIDEWLWKYFCENYCEFKSDMEKDRLQGFLWKETFKRNHVHHKIRRQWMNGQFSQICRCEEFPPNHMTVLDQNTWGDIFEAELSR